MEATNEFVWMGVTMTRGQLQRYACTRLASVFGDLSLIGDALAWRQRTTGMDAGDCGETPAPTSPIIARNAGELGRLVRSWRWSRRSKLPCGRSAK